MFVFDRAKALLQDWKSATFIRGASSTHQQPERISKWVKPSPGRFKCNVDASFSEISNMVGIGMCIMDENGTFVLTKQECFSPICEVHIGEALELLSALDWVHNLNLGPVDFELDAKRVVDGFNSLNCGVTEFGNIIEHCKSLFSNYYVNSHVEFVQRQANEVAHNLAKTALLSASSQLVVEISYCIEHILMNEMLYNFISLKKNKKNKYNSIYTNIFHFSIIPLYRLSKVLMNHTQRNLENIIYSHKFYLSKKKQSRTNFSHKQPYNVYISKKERITKKTKTRTHNRIECLIIILKKTNLS